MNATEPEDPDTGPTLSRPASAAPALIQVPDWNAFHTVLLQGRKRARRGGWPLAVLHAQVLPGPHGRPSDRLWEAALLHCASRLRGRVRATDEVVRVGADAFGLLLHGANHAGALAAGMRLGLVCSGSYRVGHHALVLVVDVRPALAPSATTPLAGQPMPE